MGILRRRVAGAGRQPSKSPLGSTPEQAAVLADVRRTIRRHGWAVISVPDGGGAAVGFQFTVGLTEHRLPEVIVYGLSPEVGHHTLNEVASRLTGGERYEDGETIADVVEGGFRFQLWTAQRLRDPLGLASALYGDALSVRQLVVPDLDDQLPWDPTYERPDLQPLLFDPP
jgi:hypothetical protein